MRGNGKKRKFFIKLYLVDKVMSEVKGIYRRKTKLILYDYIQ